MDKQPFKRLLLLPCLLAFLASIAFFGAGCQTSNNEKDLSMLLTHISASGIKIDSFDGLDPDPARAESAIIAKISGIEVGFYKFNVAHKKEKDHLKEIKERGWIGVAGRKIPAVVNGSFVMIEFDSNPQKDKLLAAFNSF